MTWIKVVNHKEPHFCDIPKLDITSKNIYGTGSIWECPDCKKQFIVRWLKNAYWIGDVINKSKPKRFSFLK